VTLEKETCSVSRGMGSEEEFVEAMPEVIKDMMNSKETN
jgi:hypothetical protein